MAVVGTGRVGLPFAAVCSKYYNTIGIDTDKDLVRRVNEQGNFSEPLVSEYVRTHNLRATTEFGRIEKCDFIFVCVGSQSAGEGYSSSNLVNALNVVTPHLISKNQILVIMTTLPLSTFDTVIIPYLSNRGVLERIAGFCYNPTMIALGNAVRDFEHPNYLLVGESNPEAGARLQSFWTRIVGDTIPIFRSSLSNIELAKYALNTALVLKITLMNALTELSEKVGADIDVQAEILKADPRIAGQKMFKGGLGYGGTCFPVDVEAFRSACEQLDVPTSLADAMQSLNERQVQRTVELIKSQGKKRVSILGVTYKPDTSVVVASQSLQVAEQLAKENYEVILYDPMGLESAKAQLGTRVLYSDDIQKAISFGNVVFLGVEWPQIRSLQAESFRKDQIVIDPWRILKSIPLRCTYLPYGRRN